MLGAVVVVVVPPPGVAAPVSVGSAAGELLEVDEGVDESPPPPPSHAPRTAARLSIKARPRIFVFIITPLSPSFNKINFSLLNTIPYLLLFFK